jgi:glycogen phosphorylase
VLTLKNKLRELGLNLWWTWQPQVIELFQEIDPALWQNTNHNPIALLAGLTDEILMKRIDDKCLESCINFHYRRLQEYLVDDRTWCTAHGGALRIAPVAYFSAEFGLHESLPLYSGGLGVLAGDVLKSASDLGIPAVGVGLFYARGYFRQRLDRAGWQQETYGASDIATFPLVHAAAPDGSTLTVRVHCGEESLHANVWIAHVGRARLVLLDSNVDSNPPHLRELTATLYGGDQVTRIRQEILLGIGGLKALRALGIRPSVLHLNEGHSAFAILERARERVEQEGRTVAGALRDTAIETVFTTHTPVEAGHDRFSADLMEQQLGWLRGRLGLDPAGFMALGRVDIANDQETFCMTVLGLKHSRRRNGVSSLHGHVARRMWGAIWPGRSEEDVPIRHITNGVHAASWLAPSMTRLYDRCLGPDWLSRQADRHTWQSLASMDDGELWEAHTVLKRRLIEFVRRRTKTPSTFDPNALTIGFARRFAAYKRATVLLTDVERLARLCGPRGTTVQFVFAGKAHPRDDDGKRLIQQIAALAHDARFTGRLAFIEDYDMNVARHLVQGVDVWLNTPLRPLEASGTSGQKAALNGGLNLSTLDGWWAEAYDGRNGFAIGQGAVHADAATQWNRDAASLYEALETEVVPLFYDRNEAGVPARWIRAMKHSMMTLGWRYNADRMVMDYASGCYLPAAGALTSQ